MCNTYGKPPGSLLRAGVKFCGGCNPRYDRGAVLEKIRERFDGRVEFVIAEEGTDYDFILYLAGCTARCTHLGAYVGNSGVVTVWGDDMHDSTIPKSGIEAIEKIELFCTR